MKIFVFSDSHLNSRYDEKFFQWVKYWSQKADKVVICGDFWDRDMCSFDEFLNSDWKDTLFPLLKSKDTHYIYGNHDLHTDSNEGVNVFSNSQSYELDLDIKEKEFHFEHGNKLCSEIDLRFLRQYGFWIQYFGFKIFGKNFLYVFKKHIKDVRRNWEGKERFLICGHTHFGAKDTNFFVMYPSAFGMQYGLMIDDGNIYEIDKYEKRKQNINS
jgi:predicted phosphodiesterase